jgi:hypothetical protein
MTRAHAAAKAFEEALEEAIEDRSLPEDAPELQDPQDLGRQAASLAVSEVAWRKVLGPLLETGQKRLPSPGCGLGKIRLRSWRRRSGVPASSVSDRDPF